MSPDGNSPFAIAQGAEINIDPGLAAASPSHYIEGDALMVVNIWNSVAGVTVMVDVRVMGTDGCITPTQQQYTPTSDRTNNVFSFPLEEGFLISVSILGQAGVPPGRTFVRAAVHRAFPANPQSAQVCVQGYVGGQNKLTWPGGTIAKTNDGRGAIRSITGTTPAPASEITETVPTGAIWRMISISFQAVMSAAAGNRYVHLIFDDGANIFMDSELTSPLANGTTYRLTFAPNLTTVQAQGQFFTAPFPPDTWLAAGFRWRTNSPGAQAGDQYSLVQYLVEEFIAP